MQKLTTCSIILQGQKAPEEACKPPCKETKQLFLLSDIPQVQPACRDYLKANLKISFSLSSSISDKSRNYYLSASPDRKPEAKVAPHNFYTTENRMPLLYNFALVW